MPTRFASAWKLRGIVATICLFGAGIAPDASCQQGPSFPSHALQSSSEMEKNAGRSGVCDLIRQRLKYIERVSESKWNTQSSIEDPEREATILKDVETKAKVAGLPPSWIQHFFRLQIEASKVIEYQLFAKWQESSQPRFPNALDLKTEIRPHLDELTDALLFTLKRDWTSIHSSQVTEAEHEGCPATNEHPDAWRIAQMPLIDRSVETVRPAPSAVEMHR
jgi:chorismate mutase